MTSTSTTHAAAAPRRTERHRAAAVFAAGGIALGLIALPTSAHADDGHHDDAPFTIGFPAGFAPEGVAAGRGDTFYAGSLNGGMIVKGDIGSRTVTPVVTAPATPVSVGLKFDKRSGLLAVAAGPTGKAAFYDARSGATVAAPTLTSGPSFINDVTVAKGNAYFTNSAVAELYRVPLHRDGTVGTPSTIVLSGPAAEFVPGFNINGIDYDRRTDKLIVVNSARGMLFAVDPMTGASSTIDLGGASVSAGDGILLDGHTLYVVRNQLNEIAVVHLSRDLASGRVVDTITSPLLEVPTTVALVDDALVLVNAQFGLPQPNPAEAVVLPGAGDHDRHDD